MLDNAFALSVTLIKLIFVYKSAMLSL
uniref:Uncharacterized protein n=1 Tax=Anguilla anguilla TaxID=7936 RepID=A0A0E9TZQ2_ANGAN